MWKIKFNGMKASSQWSGLQSTSSGVPFKCMSYYVDGVTWHKWCRLSASQLEQEFVTRTISLLKSPKEI